MTTPVRVPETDVTYLPAESPSGGLPDEVHAFLTAVSSRTTVLWASEIKRGAATYAGMYCGPPVNVLLIDPGQVPGNDAVSADLAVATLIHEIGHAAFTPAAQETQTKKVAKRVRHVDKDLFEALLEVLEDERIELLITQQRPVLLPYLRRRWDWMIKTQGIPAVETGGLVSFGPQEVLAIARLDYLHRMIGERAWYQRPVWQKMSPALKRVLARIRKIKRDGLRIDDPKSVPSLACEIIEAARRTAP